MIVLSLLFANSMPILTAPTSIDEKLFGYVESHLEMGFRIPGTEGSEKFKTFAAEFTTKTKSWSYIFHNFSYMDTPLTNILITKSDRGTVEIGSNLSYFPELLVGAHFDSRARATKDSNFPDLPVPGANDAGSGVSIVFALMEALDLIDVDVGFILFDGEDQGYDRDYGMPGWTWIRGSTVFAEMLSESQVDQIGMFLLLDMVGDSDLQIKKERNSNQTLNDLIWNLADEMGYSSFFLEETGYGIIDDHVPFIRRGIPSVDLIDFDFPFHHTTNDNLNAVSGTSMAIVYNVTLRWVETFFNLDASQITSSSTLISSSTDISESGVSSISIVSIFIIVIVRRKGVSKP